jgi:hypothetical protein
MDISTLYCTVLYDTGLQCIALHYTALHYTALDCNACPVLHCTGRDFHSIVWTVFKGLE